MDVNAVLSQLIINEASFPALKLAWDCKIDFQEVTELPKLSPSHYMIENKLTTEERLALLSKQQRKISCRKPGAEVIVEPAMIVFQNYNYGDTLNVPITIRNIGKGLQKVTILMDETGAFKFDESSQRVLRFPCGMAMTAMIRFQPNDDSDYYHKLVVVTSQTRFAIPIIGIGARGLLNFSDSIIFESVPVKCFKTKTIPVCNLGGKMAKFSLTTTGPFCVKPEKGLVLPNENFLMEVSHYSELCGESEGHLLIKYDNGEEVYVYLKAQTVNEDIKLYPQDVICDDTYLGMKTKFLCTIQNNGDTILDFKWTKHPIQSQSEEDLSELREMGGVDWQGGGDNLGKAIDLLEHCGEGNDCLGFAMDLEDQIISNMGTSTDETFEHENFIIEPLVGKVQPRGSTDIYVIFSPLEPTLHNATAYLDITGNEDRIPFTVSGKGLGPKFRFGFETVDLGTVYLGGSHSYEIPVANKSEINGKIEFDGLLLNTSGMNMKVEPRKLYLSPEEHGAFYLTFLCSGEPGEFYEELKFTVKKTNEVIYVNVKGSTSRPNVHFTDTEVSVGEVSYGFPKSLQVSLVNDTLNQFDVCIKMDENGKDPVIDYQKILDSFKLENFEFDQDSAEFTLEPTKFTLAPRGMQRITVTICANQIREIKRKLICFVADSKGLPLSEIASLPIEANCVVPKLKTEIPEIKLTECYMQVPYPIELQIINPTALSACYCIVPKLPAKVRIQSDDLVGIAGPGQVTKVPCTVVSVAVGNFTASYDVFSVGTDEKSFRIVLKMQCIPVPVPLEEQEAEAEAQSRIASAKTDRSDKRNSKGKIRTTKTTTTKPTTKNKPKA